MGQHAQHTTNILKQSLLLSLLGFLLLWGDIMTIATLMKENIELGLAYSSEVWSIIAMVGNTVACQQTWCWSGSWEFYIQMSRQQEETISNWAWLGLLNQQNHNSNIATPYESIGTIFIQTTTLTKPGALQFGYTDWPVSLRHAPVSASQELWLQVSASMARTF